ncbi:hypothetical protein [Pseudodesulfovibrio indicus]|uniref:Transmembrane protein n=1 Tax=Pseudodesulfovibrio indicus TaxID=1716143 RepID=A0A140D9G6_9BACT|nr:hypothetical protein [Pseudodesulfovibrio indicus]AMK09833.1 hypothetical protein AWY79_01275 [Pseudodesulfovibrio indicus]TDT87489.1 hypothetical protein EDC59_108155 [Pseudodesulfovibrio indicus]
MRYDYTPLPQEAACPFCTTEVPAGASVCTGCGAVFVTKRRLGRMALYFFLGGLILGHSLTFGTMLVFASVVAALGAWGVNWSDARKPFWLRDEP